MTVDIAIDGARARLSTATAASTSEEGERGRHRGAGGSRHGPADGEAGGRGRLGRRRARRVLDGDDHLHAVVAVGGLVADEPPLPGLVEVDDVVAGVP